MPRRRKQKGDLRVDTLALDLSSPKLAMHWAEIMDRINAARCRRRTRTSPRPDEAARIVEWIAAQLNEAEAARQATGERVTFHKLTREEYATRSAICSA